MLSEHVHPDFALTNTGQTPNSIHTFCPLTLDVAIAVDMIRLAMSGYMNTAILFSSDNDLMPAVEVLWGMPQCHVEVASWSGAHRVRFPGTQQPWCHHLNDTDFHAVRDTYDHTAHE